MALEGLAQHLRDSAAERHEYSLFERGTGASPWRRTEGGTGSKPCVVGRVGRLARTGVPLGIVVLFSSTRAGGWGASTGACVRFWGGPVVHRRPCGRTRVHQPGVEGARTAGRPRPMVATDRAAAAAAGASSPRVARPRATPVAPVYGAPVGRRARALCRLGGSATAPLPSP
eukprot:TRINITY_DN20058_c0_g1_i1.p3 TRINITY_DN20058_c0_g1~~TRINITY_DN20058_c0_g1_i1.p3  ORF type:complete len:172 (-),score=10.21 TRINITY_DN20058_c0_g1_i1:27-542(-)